MQELRQAFDSLDEYGDGAVGRDELLAFLDSDHPHLLDMLKACFARGQGTIQLEERQQREGMSEGCREPDEPETKAPSVFDVIEAHDDELITWDEVNESPGLPVGNRRKQRVDNDFGWLESKRAVDCFRYALPR